MIQKIKNYLKEEAAFWRDNMDAVKYSAITAVLTNIALYTLDYLL